MSLKYFARYRFNGSDVAEEDFGLRDLAVESGSLNTADDTTHGSCLSLDGATSLLSTGSFTNIADYTDRCLSFWAKTNPASAGSAAPVLCYGELASPDAFVLYARNSNGYPEYYDYSTRITDPSPTVGVEVDTWTFFTFSCKAGVISIYVDGNLWYSQSITLTTGTSDPLRLGTDGQGEYFTGYLLDLRIWETSLEGSVPGYMFSVGPNYEEELSTQYAEDTHQRSSIMTGNVLCRTTYGVQTTGSTLTQSFFCLDENSDIQEAARIEHIQDSSGVASETIRVRHTEPGTNNRLLEKTIEITPETITFLSTPETADSETSSVIFSSQGVHLVAGEEEKGCIFFGAGRDFRIRVRDKSFLVEAFSSVTDDYQIKMAISS
ncbi:unnamed protein product [Sphacelaria rigidula]